MEKLLEILEEVKPGVDFENETELVDSGILDSMTIIRLVTAISDEYDIEIPAEELETIETINDVIEYLRSKGIED